MTDSPHRPGRPAPSGFTALATRTGPYLSALGPLYQSDGPAGGRVLGLWLEASHTNIQGIAHGGMLLTLADGALGLNLALHRQPSLPMVTVSMTSDFLSPAHTGDWLEAHVTVRRTGRALSFGECLLQVDGRAVLRASAIFAVVQQPAAAEPGDG